MLDPDVGSLGRVQFFLLCFSQPFFYGAATRVPFIFAGIYARLEIGLSWIEVVMLIGTYQACIVGDIIGRYQYLVVLLS